MKRCPACQLTYVDEALKFCRHDGASLISVSGETDSQATLVKLPSPSDDSTPTEIFRPVVSPGGATSSSLTIPLRRRRSARAKAIDSLAILPFINASADPHAEYLSDGITESIINSLSRLPRLRVVPRTTVFRYKGRGERDPQEVGRELGVRAVLVGRVVQLENELVVKTELIDVVEESQLWGERYRRRPTDIFALEEEISQEISEQLRLKLSGEEKKRIGKRYTQDTRAYHYYLKGRYYTNKRTTEWIKKGIEHFQQAIDLDPNYALCYAGMADAYAFLSSSTGERAPVEFYPKAKAAALKALEIDDSLAEAHTSLGFYWLMYDWNFREAERAFKRAVELNPNYANAHDGYSFYYKATGQHEQAIRACRQAQKLDPLSLFATVSLAWAYYFARQFERAIEQNQKALEMDPRFVFAHWSAGLACAQQGRMEESTAALERAVEHSGGGLTFKAHLGYVYALAGRRAEAARLVEELKELAGQRYVPAYYVAIIYLGLGEHDEVFDWIESALAERSGFLAFIKVEPMFDPLRADQRFIDLTGHIGNGT